MKDKLINAKVIYPTLGHTVLTTGQDIHRDENVEVIVHVGTKASGHAWFEFHDTKWDGEKYYAEGGLEIDGGKLVDYDGVGSLPTVVMDILDQRVRHRRDGGVRQRRTAQRVQGVQVPP